MEDVEVQLTDGYGNKFVSSSNASGDFVFGDDYHLYPGIYTYILKKDGFKNVSGTISLKSDVDNYTGILYMQGEKSLVCKTISGTIKDVSSKKPVSGLKVSIIRGSNNTSGEAYLVTITDHDGYYQFTDIPIGYYTIVVSDERNIDESLYELSSMEVFARADEYIKKDCLVSLIDYSDEIVITLTWAKSAYDLDSHLYAYIHNRNRLHCHFGELSVKEADFRAELEKDSVLSTGKEVMKVKKGVGNTFEYKVNNFLHNSSSSTALSKTKAEVTISQGGKDILKYKVPKGDGYTWDVFKYDANNNSYIEINKIY